MLFNKNVFTHYIEFYFQSIFRVYYCNEVLTAVTKFCEVLVNPIERSVLVAGLKIVQCVGVGVIINIVSS